LIETERLLLRKPQLDDVDDVLGFVGDHEVMRWIGGEAGGREAAIRQVEKWIARWEADGVGPFAVVHDGRVIGRVGLLVWDRRSWEPSTYERAGEYAVTELGWVIARAHWGQGLATEAARAVREWTYAERGIERLISLIEPKNIRSIRVADKLGAVPDELVATVYGPLLAWLHPSP
jgi:[ribosomal protein S5]-alanine N-acetyltransferase